MSNVSWRKTLIAFALAYALRGWRVFPAHGVTDDGQCTCGTAGCASAGKHPRTLHGVKDATTDPKAIERFDWDGSNIAIATGIDFVVIDVDAKHGARLEPTTTGWSLIDGNGVLVAELPPSRVVRTGGGGHHWHGRSDRQIKNSSGALGKGIDVRGVGGYVVTAPSRHRSGSTYEVETDGELAQLPAELLDRLTKKKAPRSSTPRVAKLAVAPSRYGQSSLDAELNAVRTAAEGCRNETLNKAAFSLGQLVAGGVLDEGEVRAQLTRAAAAAGMVDPDDGIQRTISSGLTAGKQNPRGVPSRHGSGVNLRPTRQPQDSTDTFEWLVAREVRR